MQLIDEGNNLSFRCLDLIQDSLEAFFKFTTVFRTRNHGAEVQRQQCLALERLWDVTGNNSAGKAFHDGGLTYTRLTDKNWVILRAPGQNLHDAANFLVTADNRVNFALACTRGEIRGVFL